MSVPSTTTLPAVGSMRRTTSRARVDLPEPLSPTSPRVVPAGMSRDDPVHGVHSPGHPPEDAGRGSGTAWPGRGR